MAVVCFRDQLVPEVLQFIKAPLKDRLPLTIDLALSLASFMDVIDAGLVTLDLFLQGLIKKQKQWQFAILNGYVLTVEG